MDRIIVLGGGGHGKVIISVLKKAALFDIHGYVDRENKGEVLGVSYLGDDSALPGLIDSGVGNAVIGVGQVKTSDVRRRIQAELSELGFAFPTVISPDAIINEGVIIGEGSVVMDGVVINVDTTIGRFCIVNTRASVDHDCKIGDFVHVAPGVVLNGGVEVGDGTLLGAGCCVMHYKRVGSDCLIGLGASVVADCPDRSVYRAAPSSGR